MPPRGFWLLAVFASLTCLTHRGEAQNLVLRGTITDGSGGLVPAAAVLLTSAAGTAQSATSANDGTYRFTNLAPGDYTITATAPQLKLADPVRIKLRASQTVNLVLQVVVEKQQVTVAEDAKPAVSTDASANAGALVLQGADLDALSDNPDDLAADLQALAGPSAGPSGGTIFIDGFSGGQLPPKNSIREIRINQNPFSPEYDRLGFGRIEIFTKPGTDKLHADLGYNFATDKWNSRNPYAAQKAPFQLHELREMVSGPLGKRASFNLVFLREWVDNGNAVNAVVLNPQTFAITPFTATPVAELRRTNAALRTDYQLNANHTLSVRYAYSRDIVRDAGTGAFNLASRGYGNDALSQTLQLTETAVLSSSIVNESRFQYFRPTTTAQANSAGAAIQVLGAFNGGGNPLGRTRDRENSFEFQNYTSVLRGLHTFRFGARVRSAQATSVAPQNYAGTYTFAGRLAPQLDSSGRPVLDANGQPVLGNISSIETYRRTLLFQQAGVATAQIRLLGGGPSQYSVNAGNPQISGQQTDVGIFFGDDWRLRPNLTLNYGLRYETQTNLHDWSNLAPRLGIAWAPRGTGRTAAKSVIRAGFGMFYDRFPLANTLVTERYNGLIQQQYFVANPDFFPAAPPVDSLPGPKPSSTLQQISASLRAPYLMQSAISYERQLPGNTTLALTYANSHGLHLLRSRAINAPLPGTYDASTPGTGVYPFGRPGLVVLMESSGLYNQNQMILNMSSKVNSRVSLNGSYAYGHARSNTDGLGTFPSSQYSLAGEYGPSAIDMRHRVSLSGTLNAKWGIRLNPLLTANTGPPFDITSGQDLYGTTLFNARPGFATNPLKPGLVQTAYGLLDPNPAPGQAIVPRNFGRGPGQIMFNVRIGRTFMFGSREGRAPVSTNPGGVSGPAGGGGARSGEPGSPFSLGGASSGGGTANRRYSLVVSMQIRNLLNHNNPGAIIGNIASPLFGQANQPAGSGNAIFSENANNRRLELQMRLTF